MSWEFAVHGVKPRTVYLMPNRKALTGFLNKHKKRLGKLTVTKAAPMPNVGKPKKVRTRKFGGSKVRFAEALEWAATNEDIGFQGLVAAQRIEVIPPEDESPPVSCEFYDQEGFCKETKAICPHFESTYPQCKVRENALARPRGMQSTQAVPIKGSL